MNIKQNVSSLLYHTLYRKFSKALIYNKKPSNKEYKIYI